MSNEQPNILLGEIKPDSPVRAVPTSGLVAGDHKVMPELTTSYITTAYYSALSNLYIQSVLPDNITETDDRPRLKVAFNRSYADYSAAMAWLREAGNELIETSPAKQYYEEITVMGDENIKNISLFYGLPNEQ